MQQLAQFRPKSLVNLKSTLFRGQGQADVRDMISISMIDSSCMGFYSAAFRRFVQEQNDPKEKGRAVCPQTCSSVRGETLVN
jgi:hypothetical protein